MGGPYLDRVIDSYIDGRLESSGAILIEGAKWCGKTRTAKERSRSALFMQDSNNRAAYLNMAYTKPSMLLEGDVPRLIDEWQIAPILWDAVRFAVDERGIPGQFILTSSSVPRSGEMMHSGTGRIARVLMRPMSLFESLESNGSISLENLFNGLHDIGSRSPLSLEDLTFALTRGGWPDSIGVAENIWLKKMRDYVDSVANADISDVDGVNRNPTAVMALLRSISRNVSTVATISTIRKDVMGDNETISDRTVVSYIDALRRIFIIEDLPAWNPPLRSKTAIRRSPKRHFVDPSIATAALGMSSNVLLRDFRTFGLLFESLCVRDLRIYAQSLGGEVFHFRDKNGLEADAIVRLKDGRWGGVEMKLGPAGVEEGSKNLLKLSGKVDEGRMREPSFLMVLTTTEYAFRREDGVLVVPIGCLKD